jgi:molybdate transport system ATP-binding protein
MGLLRFDCRFRYPEGFQLDVQFETEARVTALQGPSGSGKSTVLSLIAGLLRPTSGTIALGDEVLFHDASRVNLRPEKRGIGIVFQDHLLFPHLTVGQNVRFAAQHLVHPIVPWDRLIEILELGDLLDRFPDTLSGGQRQRVALGRALIRGPNLLLMDEPLNAQDQALKDRILEYLQRSIQEWRIPTLLVTHSKEDALRLADRVLFLDGGKLAS